jgi:hypothetical protein
MGKYCLFFVISAFLATTAQAVDLTGYWTVSPDADIYVRQIDSDVWWYCESVGVQPGWTSVANGTVDGTIVNLRWVDVPKGNATLDGTLTLNITSDDEMQLIDQTGGWGGEDWKDIKIVRSASEV